MYELIDTRQFLLFNTPQKEKFIVSDGDAARYRLEN